MLVPSQAGVPREPHNFVAHESEIFFIAHLSETGRELWRTDGTPEGTELFHEFLPGPDHGIDPYGLHGLTFPPLRPQMAVFGDALLIAGYSGDGGFGLWRINLDAEAASHEPVLLPGTAGLDPDQFTVVPGTERMLFTANGRDVWRADATSASRILDTSPYIITGLIPYAPGRVVLSAALASESNPLLYLANGRPGNTPKLIQSVDLKNLVGRFFPFGGSAYLKAEEEGAGWRSGGLWKLTNSGRALRLVENTAFLKKPAIVGTLHDELLFRAHDLDVPLGLYGTTGHGEPRLIGELKGGLDDVSYHGYPDQTTTFNGYSYFFNNAGHGRDLYRTDGDTVELLVDNEALGTRIDESSIHDLGGSLMIFTWNTYLPSAFGVSQADIWFVDYHQNELVLIEDHGFDFFSGWEQIGSRVYFNGIVDGVSAPWYYEAADLQPDLAAITGTWYDPALPGQGFMMHPLDDDRMLLTFYGFDADGAQLWLTGMHEGPISLDAPLSIDLSSHHGGAFGSFEPDQVIGRHWGEVELLFSDCTSGSATLTGESGVQQLEIRQLAGVLGFECDGTTDSDRQAASAGLSGSWYDPATAGQGMMMHPVDDQTLVVTMFAFEQDGDPLWLVGTYEGELGLEMDLRVPMFTATGGGFEGFDPSAVSVDPWGTLDLRFDDCNAGRAILDGIEGRQALELQKLTAVLGAGCGLLYKPHQTDPAAQRQ